MGALLNLSNCSTTKDKDLDTEITNTYIINTCDKEERAYLIEMKHKGESYTGFISTQNQHLIPSAQKKFKVGMHTNMQNMRNQLDGVYRTHE